MPLSRVFPIDVIRPQTWAECRDFACYLGGGNPSLHEDQCYSQAHYDSCCQIYGDPKKHLKKLSNAVYRLNYSRRAFVFSVVSATARVKI